MQLLIPSLFAISLLVLVSFSFNEADATWTLEVRVNRIEMAIIAPDPNGGGEGGAVLGVLDDSIVVLKQILLDDNVISLLKSSDRPDIAQAILCLPSSIEPRCVLSVSDPESARAALMGYLEIDVGRGDYHRPPVIIVFLNTIGVDDDCDGVVDRSGNSNGTFFECWPDVWTVALDSDESSEGSLELAKNTPSNLTNFSIPDSDGNLVFDGPAILYNNMVIVAVDSNLEYGFALERIHESWWSLENDIFTKDRKYLLQWYKSSLAELIDVRPLNVEDGDLSINSEARKAPGRSSWTPNLSASLSSISQNTQVIKVVINDADIAGTDEPKGEPDVTVNGRILRMVQAVDGDWYGIFANNMEIENEDWDSCSDSPDTSDVLDISLDDGVGCRFPPVPSADGRNYTYDVNPGSSTVSAGQIGIAENVWPFIQLYDYSPDQDIIVQYNKGGAIQMLTLSFEEAEEQLPFELIPGIEITIERISFQTVEETSLGTSKSSNEDESVEQVPQWIKNNAGWWAEGLIGDTDFVGGIQYMIEHGIISMPGFLPDGNPLRAD